MCCAVEIGKILAANKMIVGSVSKFGEVFTINIRLVNVEKGLSECAEYIKADGMDDIPEKIGDLVKIITRRITSGEPQAVIPVSIQPWEQAGLTEGIYNKITALELTIEDYQKMKEMNGELTAFKDFKKKGFHFIDYLRALELKIFKAEDYHAHSVIKRKKKCIYGASAASISVLSTIITSYLAYDYLLKADDKYDIYQNSSDSGELEILHGEIEDLSAKADFFTITAAVSAGICAVSTYYFFREKGKLKSLKNSISLRSSPEYQLILSYRF